MIATLRRRDFSLVWSAGLISQTGDWVLYVALPIYVYRVTGSALATSIMFLVEIAPILVLGSVAGVFADRWDRKRTMVIANLLMAIGLLPLLLVHSAATVPIAYAVSFIEAVVAQFFAPAESALLPTLAGEGNLVSANSLLSLGSSMARLTGPAIGGVIAARFGLGGVTALDAVSFLLAAGLVLLVRAPGRAARAVTEPVHAAERVATALWREWREGLALMWRQRQVTVLLAMFGISALGEGVFGVIFVVWVRVALHGGAQDIGWLMSAQAVGGIVGGLAIGALGSRLAPRYLAVGGAILFGLIDAALFTYPVLRPILWPGLLFIAIVGIPASATNSSWTTLLQQGVPDELRGRVFGALGTTQGMLRLIGLLAAGLLGSLLSPILLLDVFQSGSYILAGLIAAVALSGAVVARVADRSPVEA